MDAQVALKQALDSLQPVAEQRRATLLTDLAGTCVLQGNFQEAYSYAVQAIKTTLNIKSQTNVQRLLALRQLEPWKHMQYTHDLDEQLLPMLTPG